ncbi:MAG: hypothetical protein K2W79_12925 [Hydrotalea flava]|nr:hypothetical protein [Hydrotalea flava]
MVGNKVVKNVTQDANGNLIIDCIESSQKSIKYKIISNTSGKFEIVITDFEYLSFKGYSTFEEIDEVIILRDPTGRIGKIVDRNNLENISWLNPQSGNTWPIHQLNSSN